MTDEIKFFFPFRDLQFLSLFQLGNAVTAVVLRYIPGTSLGIVRTTSVGHGLFSTDAMVYSDAKEANGMNYRR